MNPLTPSTKTTIRLVLIALTLSCVVLSPKARAGCQEGCLRNDNTAVGTNALINTTGGNNTANGFQALLSNTIGNSNTATGWEALTFNITGNNSTATGAAALQFNTTGSENTATGAFGLFANTIGTNNTANGAFALAANTTGIDNTATGEEALQTNVTGTDNTAIGTNALFSSTGSFNIALGSLAGRNLTTGSNNIDIGNKGVAVESNTMRFGTTLTQTNTYIAGISGVTVASGVDVIIDTNGHLGTIVSSARYKENIQPMNDASEAILSLQPVTFRYKKDLDPDGVPQFGLVAEEVDKVNPDLVARDAEGKPYTVRYEAVNAMLLNEFLKEHRKVEQLTKGFESKLAEQQKQIQQLTSGLQKVNAQLQLSKPVPQTVVSSP